MPVKSQIGPPKLLMISGCVPAPEGPARRRRAWRLLQAADRQHAVYLAAIADGPVNLNDWRRVDGLAHRYTLLPDTRERSLRRTLQRTIASWQAAAAFDLVVCDAAGLWHVAESIDAADVIDSTDHAAALRALQPMGAPLITRHAA